MTSPAWSLSGSDGVWHSVLTTDDDLDLALIAESGQCFRWEELPDGGYGAIHKARRLTIEPIGPGTFGLSCDNAEFLDIWADYLDLNESYRAIRERIDAHADPFLARAAEAEKGIRILRQDPWETLVSFIISQNRNIPAIKRSIELLCEKAGRACVDSQGQPFFAFPSPEEVLSLGMEGLADCKLGYRDKYVLAAARSVLDGEIDLNEVADSDADAAIEMLMTLYGVGKKVASCVALFGFHKLDAFPVDVWVKRVLKSEYPQGYPLKAYSPYNGVYQQYMFAFYRNGQEG